MLFKKFTNNFKEVRLASVIKTVQGVEVGPLLHHSISEPPVVLATTAVFFMLVDQHELSIALLPFANQRIVLAIVHEEVVHFVLADHYRYAYN